MRKLNVFVNDTFAGELIEEHPGLGYVFQYSRAYLDSEGIPVSVTLPKRNEPYISDSLFPFFANIIPEGANRRTICRHLKIDEKDLFGILSAMADQEFVGAVNIKSTHHHEGI